MKPLRILFFAALSSLMLSGAATAAVLFDNGTATGNQTNPSQTGGVYTGFSYYVADDFTLVSNSTINSVHWTLKVFGGAGSLPNLNGARAWILSAPGPLSSNTLHTITLQSGTPTAHATLAETYDLTLNGLSISLNAGTYWIAFQSDLSGPGLAASSLSNASGNSEIWTATGSTALFPQQSEVAFRIEGTSAPVPLPSTLGLLLLSGLAIPLVRRFAH